jgi:hypothetical protein
MALVFCRALQGLPPSASAIPQNIHPSYYPAASTILAANKLLSGFFSQHRTAKKFVYKPDGVFSLQNTSVFKKFDKKFPSRLKGGANFGNLTRAISKLYLEKPKPG